MAHINYYNLKKYFTEEESLSIGATLRNIWRVCNLPKEFKEVVLKITDNHPSEVLDFSVDDVSIRDLVEKENMKYIQAVFFLDWLRREPDNARAYMASRRFRNPIQTISDEERNELVAFLERTKKSTGTHIPTVLVPEFESEEDINVETESEYIGVMTAEVPVQHTEMSPVELQQMVDDAVSQVKEAK